ncbi:hypothetical protein MIND_00286400 [Mycena indigotica]|uniref:Uncharacterized protein n=1 Tax=Mycena indigotica TaxID=2126181 RepID=A0A8H6T9K9_9AGAR|nr:uncharacterized protein MIND_00286400 [Mycena indigotica]KAF7312716.1 hypothetical protein MIND_00286400 [Mycena indigotica]
MSNKLYGRNRDSVADLETDLHSIFEQHPDSSVGDDGTPIIPAHALVDVLKTFADSNGVELLSPEETEQLKALLATNPDLEVTPQITLAFIATRTKNSPPQSPPMTEDELDSPRGRQDDRSVVNSGRDSRSSSIDSVGTSRNHSRPPSRGVPQTPNSTASPFDTSRRQRSTPLGGNAPSSWATKRPPHHRRKSDAGSRSDSEQVSASPSAYGRPAGRIRAPSNPTSPSTNMMDDFDNPGSPPPNGRFSRPSSRQQGRRPTLDEDLYNDLDHTFRQGLNSLPMPRPTEDDSDSDDEARMDMVMDRSAASSTVSMMPQDRVEALQRVNDDLTRKLMENERTLQNKLAEHESIQEELQSKLDELSNELSAAKREEKELRIKERSSHHQIQTLEAEISKVNRQLEASKASYAKMNKLYQDQLSMANKYRDEIRERDASTRDRNNESEALNQDIRKLKVDAEIYETRIAQLEEELAAAQQAHIQLDEQKQENMLLKETIDRMRFDLDEMRSNNASAVAGGSSGHSSAANTISKSLGAELLKMKGGWNDEPEEEAADVPASTSSPNEDDEDTEGEDVIQTIITRKKRKVQSKAMDNRMQNIQRREFEERKEYSDMATQYDLEQFYVSCKTQTDAEVKIITASLSTQTDPEPVVEPPPPRNTVEMEIQTEADPEEDVKPDAPPAYKKELSPEEQEEHDWRVTVATLKKYHPGSRLEEGVPDGISLDALEDWRALKEELGVSCLVVDKIIENSPHTGLPRAPSDAAGASPRRRSGRFYNIYNTYVYGGKTPHPQSNANPFPVIPSAMFWIGVTSIAFLAVGPSLLIPYYTVPGGPTMHDRAVWNSFNTMKYAGEGFTHETDALWGLLGRVTGGAARMVRGWPQ